MKKNYLLTGALVILFTGIGFFGGMQYQKNQRSSFTSQFGTRMNQIGGNGQSAGQSNDRIRGGFRPTSGEIISVDDKSITVKMNDGSSKIILLSNKTQINKAEKAEIADLKIGETISVFGIENSDGSQTAQNIQLNPISRIISPAIPPLVE